MDALAELWVHLVPHLSENQESLLRLLIAAALGAVIGIEREASGKPAGFRTNMLICIGAALITDVSALVARDVALPGGFRADPGRIAAQVVSGVGFLGAGTILQSRGSVTGLTTAATLWVVAAIGIAVGAGAYAHALVGTALVLLALMILGRFGDHLLPRRADERTVRVVMVDEPALPIAVQAHLADAGCQIRSVDVERGGGSLTGSYVTRGPRADLDRAIQSILAREGVRRISVH